MALLSFVVSLVCFVSIPISLVISTCMHQSRVSHLYAKRITELRAQASQLPPGSPESAALLANADHLELLEREFTQLTVVERVMMDGGEPKHSRPAPSLDQKQAAANERQALLARNDQGEIAQMRQDARLDCFKDGVYLAVAIPAGCILILLILKVLAASAAHPSS